MTITQKMKITISKIKRVFVYFDYDSSEYWKKRANEPDQLSVLWKNQEYNELYRNLQVKIIKKYLSQLPEKSQILDIGCGIGMVAKMIVDNHVSAEVDAVDFTEMINIAKIKNGLERINYIESSAEEYLKEDQKYQLIISSGCFSAIRNIEKMKQAMFNSVQMLDNHGIILMIGPFHYWNYLARVKFSSEQVIALIENWGLENIEKSGVLFWPYREWLANSIYSGDDLKRKFNQGEWLLSKLGKHFWADYKILAFKKNRNTDNLGDKQ